LATQSVEDCIPTETVGTSLEQKHQARFAECIMSETTIGSPDHGVDATRLPGTSQARSHAGEFEAKTVLLRRRSHHNYRPGNNQQHKPVAVNERLLIKNTSHRSNGDETLAALGLLPLSEAKGSPLDELALLTEHPRDDMTDRLM
jgi:hypothetical protein